MEFFIPHAASPEEGESVYKSIRDFLAKQGIKTTERRIRRIEFKRDRTPLIGEVGVKFYILREEVIAIVRDAARPLYYICTASRGVVRDGPYLIGDNEVTAIEDFDSVAL